MMIYCKSSFLQLSYSRHTMILMGCKVGQWIADSQNRPCLYLVLGIDLVKTCLCRHWSPWTIFSATTTTLELSISGPIIVFTYIRPLLQITKFWAQQAVDLALHALPSTVATAAFWHINIPATYWTIFHAAALHCERLILTCETPTIIRWTCEADMSVSVLLFRIPACVNK